MDRNAVINALNVLRERSDKRNFVQSVDFIITLKDLDLKKPEGQVDFFLALPKPTGRSVAVCALVGAELFEQAKKFCDKAIVDEEFSRLDKKTIKCLSRDFTHFIAQASLMTSVAKTFGRILGPRGKMPNPKAGAVVPPNANLEQVSSRLRQTSRVSNKGQAAVKVLVGREDMSNDDIADNVLAVFSNTVQKLPQENNNVKFSLLKFTMSKPVRIT